MQKKEMSILNPKLSKPRSFNYKPRFYDPEREKFDEIRKRYASGDDYVPGQIVKTGFKREITRNEERRKRRKKPMRLTIMILLAAFLIYFFFVR
ncbi:MAG: hypothetical protein ACOXZ9_00220 [Bacteroidales bacterium]